MADLRVRVRLFRADGPVSPTGVVRSAWRFGKQIWQMGALTATDQVNIQYAVWRVNARLREACASLYGLGV